MASDPHDMKSLNQEIKRAIDVWETTIYQPNVKKVPERKKEFKNLSEIPIKPLYTPLDTQRLDYNNDLGFPGQYPFTRGVYPTMYRGSLWTMRQFAGLGDAEASNQRYKFLIKNGTTGLSVAFHLPTIYGVESTDPLACGEVGKDGVAIDSLQDMEDLFVGIDLGKISTSMTINAPASILLCMYCAVGEKQGVPLDKLTGTIQNDILKEYIAQKSWIYPPEHSVRIIVDIMEWCSKNVPKWNTISISGYHIREAGSTAVQELAFTLADGFTYVEEGIKRGLNVDDFAPRLSFFFNAHNNFFEEIAKYRAARRIWAKRMKNKYGAKNDRSMMLRFHTQTAGVSLTAQEPENNIVRVTLQALAAVLGGTQSLHTNSFDEALALPTEKAVRIALRTQQIIAHESGVADTIDPLAGSYFVETLTNQMEEEAEKYFKAIDDLGGVIPAIKQNFFQKEIARASYKYQMDIEKKERIMVCVNDFCINQNEKIEILKISDEYQSKQIEKLKKLKTTRDNQRVQMCLDKITAIAKTKQNLLPYIYEAVKAYATVGEIINAMKQVFGVYQEDSIY